MQSHRSLKPLAEGRVSELRLVCYAGFRTYVMSFRRIRVHVLKVFNTGDGGLHDYDIRNFERYATER